MMNANDHKLLKINEVCSTFGISRSTLYRRIADGTFAHPIRFGGLVRWHQADIEAVIRRSRPASAEEAAR